MKKILLVLFLYISYVGISQCNYDIDTTITPVTYNINMSSNAVQDSNLCIEALDLFPNDSVWVSVRFIATSEIMVVDHVSFGFGDKGCNAYVSQGWFLITSNCDSLPATPSHQWHMPYSNQPDSVLNGFGWKHFVVPDSLIGDTLIARRSYMSLQGGDESCNITPCFALYSAGVSMLKINTIQPSDLTLEIYPNPVRHTVNLKSDIDKELLIFISNTAGQLISTSRKQVGVEMLSIYVEDLPSGMYLVSARTKDGSRITKKIIIE